MLSVPPSPRLPSSPSRTIRTQSSSTRSTIIANSATAVQSRPITQLRSKSLFCRLKLVTVAVNERGNHRIRLRVIQRSPLLCAPGLVKFVPAVNRLFCLALPGSFLTMFVQNKVDLCIRLDQQMQTEIGVDECTQTKHPASHRC